MAGVTPEGFVKKTIEDVKSDIEGSLTTSDAIDPGLNLQADQPIGQINAIVSRVAAELWEVAEVCYHAFDPDGAEGRLLDNIAKITGVLRDKATKSIVIETCNLNAGFEADAGTMMINDPDQPEVQWVNQADIGPVLSTGDYQIQFENTQYGPIAALAGTLTNITNPMTGWNSATNAADAEEGFLEERDVNLRQRRVDETAAPGASTTDAIRTDLLEVNGVQQAFVYENTSLVTNGDGVPGKAIECVVFDGAGEDAEDADIAQAIWDSKPSGSETYGSLSAYATDATGETRVVNFSRCTIETVWIEIDLDTTSDYPAAGDTLVKEAIVARGNLLNLNDDVIALVLKSAALTVQGVRDVTALRLGFTASPVGTANLTITGRQIARFDTSRVLVSS